MLVEFKKVNRQENTIKNDYMAEFQGFLFKFPFPLLNQNFRSQ